jgi:hypothetical protein
LFNLVLGMLQTAPRLLRLGCGALRIFLIFFQICDFALRACQLRSQTRNRLIQLTYLGFAINSPFA